ncbi:MAG: diguanylate cyclase [Acidobacteria bacterium]|nr:diguanylate cyclase [Acidobacteriota bacterium]
MSDRFTAKKASEDKKDRSRDIEELVDPELFYERQMQRREHLIAEEARLKEYLAELEASSDAVSQMVDNLQMEMEARNKECEEVAELRHRATHDDLTGLWNREAILDILKRELVRAEREGLSIGVLLADLDLFKYVNDTYGHLAGDVVLRESCQRISAAVRYYDAVGRYGDDYFLILLLGWEDEIDILRQAEKIRLLVCSEPVHTTEGSITITISIGAASSANLHEEESIIRAADAALYRAKRAGGNRVEWAVPKSLKLTLCQQLRGLKADKDQLL